jgi:biopolymer transport protein ExbD
MAMAAHAEHAGIAGHVGPNMTPMVDVGMCILIFFMLGSAFLSERFLPAELPRVGAFSGPQEVKMPAVRTAIKLAREGADTWVSAFDRPMMKMNRRSDREQSQNRELAAFFLEKGRTLSPDVQIMIYPEKGVPYQDVITVYDCCIKAGFRQVAFAPAR